MDLFLKSQTYDINNLYKNLLTLNSITYVLIKHKTLEF